MKLPARCLAVLLACASAVTVLLPDAFRADAADYTLAHHTQDEIRAYLKAHPWNVGTWRDEVPYASKPSYKSPYALGKITDGAQQEALNTLNFCRYVAGLPADITAKSDYIELAQAASLVSAANDVLSHFPNKPAGMSDALYTKGKTGAGESNLGVGYFTIPNSVITGYMYDSDDFNIPMVGHRRWILNPSMLYSGFGAAGEYTAMYAFDESRKNRFTGDYVAWPPENMPYELYTPDSRYTFSVSLTGGYDAPKKANVKIDMTSKKLGKTYHIDSSSLTNKRYLSVNNEGYGLDKCIIFYPGVQFPEDDTVTVKITGITKSGKASPLTYTVNFFSLNAKSSQPEQPGTEAPAVTTAPQTKETQPKQTKEQPVTQKTEPDNTAKQLTKDFPEISLSKGDKIALIFKLSDGALYHADIRYQTNGANRSVPATGSADNPLAKAHSELRLTLTAVDPMDHLSVDMEYIGTVPELTYQITRAQQETEPPPETTTTTTTTTTAEPTTTTPVPLFSPGDLNGNGEIDIADVVLLVRVAAEDSELSLADEALDAADVNRDSLTDMTDIRLLLDFLATMVKNF